MATRTKLKYNARDLHDVFFPFLMNFKWSSANDERFHLSSEETNSWAVSGRNDAASVDGTWPRTHLLPQIRVKAIRRPYNYERKYTHMLFGK